MEPDQTKECMHNKGNYQHIEWEKIFVNPVSVRGLMKFTKNSCNSTAIKANYAI